MARLPNGSVDLIYLPADILSADRRPARMPSQLSLFADDAEMTNSPGGQRQRNGLDEELALLAGHIRESKRLLTRNGNLYVHCTPDRQQHLRKILDETFSEERFQN